MVKRKEPRRCPKCGSPDVVPILYGCPTPEGMEAAERGEIRLGGCCVTDRDPSRFCRACEHSFDLRPFGAARKKVTLR